MSFVCLSRVQQVCNAFATLRNCVCDFGLCNSTEPTEPWTNCCTCDIWACCICCICCLRQRRDLLGYGAWLKMKTSLFLTMLASFQRIEPIESVCLFQYKHIRYFVRLVCRQVVAPHLPSVLTTVEMLFQRLSVDDYEWFWVLGCNAAPKHTSTLSRLSRWLAWLAPVSSFCSQGTSVSCDLPEQGMAPIQTKDVEAEALKQEGNT